MKKKSYIYALGAVFFWSTVSSAFKLSLRHMTVVPFLFYSSLTASLVLFVMLALRGKLHLLRDFTVKDLRFSAMLGFLTPFLYYLVLLKAYTLLPAQQAQPLNMFWGIVAVILAIPLLKQKARPMDWLALAVCFLGVIVIATQGRLSELKFTDPLGAFLAVGSSVIWAFYFILNVRDKKDPMARLLVNFSFGTLFIMPLYLFNFSAPSWQGLAGAFYTGLFEMGITFFLWLTAMKLSGSTVNVAVLVYLVPFLSFLFIHILVGEEILLSSVLGALLIVVGILLNKYAEFAKK